MATVYFDASPYKRSHGKAPRGRGNWAFRIEGVAEIFFANGLLMDAKSQARAKALEIEAAQARGDAIVYVDILP